MQGSASENGYLMTSFSHVQIRIFADKKPNRTVFCWQCKLSPGTRVQCD